MNFEWEVGSIACSYDQVFLKRPTGEERFDEDFKTYKKSVSEYTLQSKLPIERRSSSQIKSESTVSYPLPTVKLKDCMNFSKFCRDGRTSNFCLRIHNKRTKANRASEEIHSEISQAIQVSETFEKMSEKYSPSQIESQGRSRKKISEFTGTKIAGRIPKFNSDGQNFEGFTIKRIAYQLVDVSALLKSQSISSENGG